MNTNPLLSEFFKGKTFEELLNLNEQAASTEVRAILNGIEKMMQEYAKNITYTQLRNILQVVKKEKYKSNLPAFYIEVIPKLAYMEARPQKKDEGKKVISFIREMAGAVKDKDQYPGFEAVMNTMVAYHKLYG